MPISLSELMQDKRSCEVKIGDETAQVVYRPSAYTPIVEDALQTAIEGRRPGTGMAEYLAAIIISWEVIGDDGEEVPITKESLSSLPSRFLSEVSAAITDDVRAGGEERKNSGAGSRKRAK